MSQGARNWPFLMFTGLPALQTLVMKSVWRTRNAGVCSTSTTLATSSIGVYSCTSVSTGTPSWRFTSASTFRPSSMPGPRKLLSDVRFALSKLDLKMKGMPSSEVISLSLPAMSSCSCHRLDHAGAGDQEERLVEADLESAELHRAPEPSAVRATQLGGCRAHPRLLQQAAAGLVLARGADEADEQRMAVARRRQELGMRLAGEEPRVVAAARPSPPAGRPSTSAEITMPASSSCVR